MGAVSLKLIRFNFQLSTISFLLLPPVTDHGSLARRLLPSSFFLQPFCRLAFLILPFTSSFPQ
jgi:hypothetical protein